MCRWIGTDGDPWPKPPPFEPLMFVMSLVLTFLAVILACEGELLLALIPSAFSVFTMVIAFLFKPTPHVRRLP